MLDAMRRAMARGTGLARQLLAFSRRRPDNPETIDIAAHLADMRAMLDATLGARIDIQTRFGSALWPVTADPGEMELALLNLCVNARDAMPAGGVITIAAENVHLASDATAADDFVILSVADTGIGMPPEVQARVFEPFFTTKEGDKGTGLGLPQVYSFAQQSGGGVTIDSTVGVGTTVTLLLPRAGEGARGHVPGTRNQGWAGDQAVVIRSQQSGISHEALALALSTGARELNLTAP